MTIYGGIEAGGTKFRCAIGSGTGEILKQTLIHTDSPDKTLSEVVAFFDENKVESIGLGCFGPIDINKDSKDYGLILNTNKAGWSNINIKNILENELGIKVEVVTDTDVAAIGELFYGKGVKARSAIYLTIGTGVGGTVIVNRDIVHGISHPEIGHMSVRIPEGFDHTNSCKYHEFCMEGYISGQSIESNRMQKAETIKDDVFWEKVSEIIAQGIVNIISILQPEVIIIGGSVMKAPDLITKIQKNTIKQINGYFETPKIEDYIVHASSDTIGVLGAIKLGSADSNLLS